MFYSPVNLIDILVTLKCMVQAQYMADAMVLHGIKSLSAIKSDYAEICAVHGFKIGLSPSNTPYVAMATLAWDRIDPQTVPDGAWGGSDFDHITTRPKCG